MSGGVNIAEFLTARLDEDEAAAVALCGGRTGRWHAYLEGGDDGWAFEAEGGGLGAIVEDEGLAYYIARHDPARVLREVAAKRQLLEWCAAVTEHFDWATLNQPGSLLHDPNARATNTATLAMQAMATPYADHPDYQEGWKL